MEATTAVLWLYLTTIATPTSDYSTETGIYFNVTSSTPGGQSRPSYLSPYYISPTLSRAFYATTIAIAVVGSLANAYVLLALLLSKNSAGNNVNVFITHQAILDFTACVFLFLGYLLNKIRTPMSESLAVFMCLFFGTHTITILATNASIGGLLVITVERYVKIVHHIYHRNHYRPWMTRAGIVLPWIYGICTSLVPAWATTRVVNGRCMRESFWAIGELKAAWGVAKFFVLYLVPLVVFVCAYWKILAVIRRRQMLVGQTQPQAGTSASIGATAAAQKNRRTEMNIVRTMIMVSVTFAVCFLCTRTYSILDGP